MPGISVNLLPRDVILQRKQDSRFVLINRVSIGLLVLLVFFTSAALAVRMLQRTNLEEAQDSLVLAQEKVKSYSDKEEQVVLLKDRLASIQTLIGGDSKRKEIFNTMVRLAPADLQITEASVDKSGIMTVSFSGTSLTSIQSLLTSLSKPDTGLNLSQMNLEGLSLGKDSVYRFTLKIVPKLK